MSQAVLAAVREFGAGASSHEITWAEAYLRVAFPPCYVSFLREFGWLAAGGLEIYGLGDDVPEYLDLVRSTRAERELFTPPLPHHLLPIRTADAGGLYCLDTERQGGHCPVVLWDPDTGPAPRPLLVAEDFAEWFVAEMDRCRPLRG